MITPAATALMSSTLPQTEHTTGITGKTSGAGVDNTEANELFAPYVFALTRLIFGQFKNCFRNFPA